VASLEQRREVTVGSSMYGDAGSAGSTVRRNGDAARGVHELRVASESFRPRGARPLAAQPVRGRRGA
jgi:hypothetical protein